MSKRKKKRLKDEEQNYLEEDDEGQSNQLSFGSIIGAVIFVMLFRYFTSKPEEPINLDSSAPKTTISQTRSESENVKQEAVFKFEKITPYTLLEFSDTCNYGNYTDFGCVLRDLHKPGGLKKVREKYDGQNIYIEQYIATDFTNGYDSVTFYDLEKMLPCHMNEEETEKLGQATNNKKGIVSISGRLNISLSEAYLEPCYFEKVYKCKAEESGAFCLEEETK